MYVPTFVLLSRLTPEGRRTLREKPERIDEVNEEIGYLGCKIVRQYAVLGPYDFVTVIEAPDNETVTQLSLALGSRGTLEIESLAAAPMGDFLRRLGSDAKVGRAGAD